MPPLHRTVNATSGRVCRMLPSLLEASSQGVTPVPAGLESLGQSLAEEGDRLEPLGPSLAEVGERLEPLGPSLSKRWRRWGRVSRRGPHACAGARAFHMHMPYTAADDSVPVNHAASYSQCSGCTQMPIHATKHPTSVATMAAVLNPLPP